MEEIFATLLTHAAKGLNIHNQLANAFGFLNLKGYQKCHEYHFLEESHDYRELQDFILTVYNKLIPETQPESLTIIPPNWYKYVKADVDVGTKRAAIRDLTLKWVEWEEETNKLLEKSYKDLMDVGAVSGALKISDMLRENCKELDYAREMFLNLEAIGYDMSLIIDEQQLLYNNFLKCIYEEDE